MQYPLKICNCCSVGSLQEVLTFLWTILTSLEVIGQQVNILVKHFLIIVLYILSDLIMNHRARGKRKCLVRDLLSEDMFEKISEFRLGRIQWRQIQGAQSIEIPLHTFLTAKLVVNTP